MLLIAGFPANNFEFDLKYKFKTEEIATGAGYEYRADWYSKPQRELSSTLGSADSFAFPQLLAVLQAGATFCISPLWPLRSPLPYGLTSGLSSDVALSDVTEYAAGEYVYLTRATQVSLHEVRQITAVVGSTIYFDQVVSRDYMPFSLAPTFPFDESIGYIMPCISGTVDHESIEFMGGRPAFLAKLKVDGGAWGGASVPGVSSYLREPMDAKYGVPKIVRDIQGTENGVLQLRSFESSNRLTFELTWDFYDTSWKELRNLFFGAKGKTGQFYMPTWMFELSVTRGSDSGAESIFLPYGYSYMWERFPHLLVKSYRTSADPFEITVTGYIGNGEFSCNALPHGTLLNDRVCLYPLVRFENDELTFQFKDINSCQVKASFIEVFVES
jgi:hypothetical protein